MPTGPFDPSAAAAETPNRYARRTVAAALLLPVLAAPAWAADYPTNFSNLGSVANTRHNLTQNTAAGSIGGAMITVRNNYGEVCVYCHTPHGANENAPRAPLWNRTFLTPSYQTYDLLGTATLSQTVTYPGINSLMCLSCHDGTIAVDSIINMPGSGRFSAAAKTSHVESHLDNNWANNAAYPGTTRSSTHHAIGNTSPAAGSGCMACHSGPGGIEVATDFTAFYLGTDLRDDHPVGIRFPQPVSGTDFNDPNTKIAGRMAIFDTNGNGRPEKNEIRMYDTGDGYEVECASCHDPHGVPSAGSGTAMQPTFLRISNANSAVCLTCHIK